MRLKIIGCLAILLTTLLSKTGLLFATHEFSSGVSAAAEANKILLGNPPLPMLYYDKGNYKVTIQPYIFNGEKDFLETDGNPSKVRGKFNG